MEALAGVVTIHSGQRLLAIPAALSIKSRSTAGSSAVYVWMYANNWEWGYLANAGFRHAFTETVGLVFKG